MYWWKILKVFEAWFLKKCMLSELWEADGFHEEFFSKNTFVLKTVWKCSKLFDEIVFLYFHVDVMMNIVQYEQGLLNENCFQLLKAFYELGFMHEFFM